MSGITIIDITRNISITVSEITKVTFREMTDEEIEEYIENVPNVLKCAGYSVGGYGKKFVSGIEGDYNNIF
ncbi:MAG: Maf family protein [Candidatus Peribacteria bacterium]|nr:Maf family protein [Candidatus Peribacteria bacterium]